MSVDAICTFFITHAFIVTLMCPIINTWENFDAFLALSLSIISFGVSSQGRFQLDIKTGAIWVTLDKKTTIGFSWEQIWPVSFSRPVNNFFHQDYLGRFHFFFVVYSNLNCLLVPALRFTEKKMSNNYWYLYLVSLSLNWLRCFS